MFLIIGLKKITGICFKYCWYLVQTPNNNSLYSGQHLPMNQKLLFLFVLFPNELKDFSFNIMWHVLKESGTIVYWPTWYVYSIYIVLLYTDNTILETYCAEGLHIMLNGFGKYYWLWV